MKADRKWQERNAIASAEPVQRRIESGSCKRRSHDTHGRGRRLGRRGGRQRSQLPVVDEELRYSARTGREDRLNEVTAAAVLNLNDPLETGVDAIRERVCWSRVAAWLPLESLIR